MTKKLNGLLLEIKNALLLKKGNTSISIYGIFSDIISNIAIGGLYLK